MKGVTLSFLLMTPVGTLRDNERRANVSQRKVR